LLLVPLQVPIILRWLLEFWEICTPLLIQSIIKMSIIKEYEEDHRESIRDDVVRRDKASPNLCGHETNSKTKLEAMPLYCNRPPCR